MVTIEVQDISKLAGFIRIPSMSEGADTANIIKQKILYSGLPNQCRKCRKFGHHALACNTILGQPQDGPALHNTPLGASSGGGDALSMVAQKPARAGKSRVRVSPKPQETKGNPKEEALEATAFLKSISQPSGQGNPELESPA
jgi:hypothetical protein